MAKLSYTEALAKDRDKYLRQRNLLAKDLRYLIARIGDHGQELAITTAREHLLLIFGPDEED